MPDTTAAHCSRRALLRRGALAGAGMMAAGVPFARLGAQALPTGHLPVLRLPEGAVARALPALTRFADTWAASGKLPNIVLAVGEGQAPPRFIARGPQTLGQPAPAGADSLYRIYSMTKPVTGMAAMILVDEGKLGLDQPLHDILPAFRDMRVLATYDGPLDRTEPAARPITIRHLITHTSGLGYSIVQKGPIAQAYARNGLVPGQVSRIDVPGFGRGRPAPSLAAFADALAQQPLVYQPGTHWSYSVGLDLMGRVIEVVSGQPFDAFVQDRILGPCGMDDTGFRVPAADVGRLTTNYGVIGGTLIPIDVAGNSVYLDAPAFPFGGAGLVSTPRDYDRFLRMLLGLGTIDGRRVMGERAVRLGTSNLLPAGVDTRGTYAAGQGFGAGGRVGLGTYAGIYGWAGAAGTLGFVDFRRAVRTGLFTQYMPQNAYDLLTPFAAAVMADFPA